ncbi:uncharacterized protein LOC116347979 isoform X2 [Contarinia nasturtii]|uniref:uncharacterized protein LOC116347979 isoform X2 n=1 Tax=Contarinia nasturtii TaxID=265458 RepID=UPI0012D419EC|nr:uncharacterized protein LOC116347979 isoform X2 [Contarinia nasturtii]
MTASASDVIKTLRSLLNSTQNGLLAKQLMREFREMEGYPVPFQQLGYTSFTHFLEKSNEFDLTNTVDGPHVRAKLTKESVHIAQLVSSQNRTKKKKTSRPMPFVQRRNINHTNYNWRNTAYPKIEAKAQVNPFMQQTIYMEKAIEQKIQIEKAIAIQQAITAIQKAYPSTNPVSSHQLNDTQNSIVQALVVANAQVHVNRIMQQKLQVQTANAVQNAFNTVQNAYRTSNPISSYQSAPKSSQPHQNMSYQNAQKSNPSYQNASKPNQSYENATKPSQYSAASVTSVQTSMASINLPTTTTMVAKPSSRPTTVLSSSTSNIPNSTVSAKLPSSSKYPSVVEISDENSAASPKPRQRSSDDVRWDHDLWDKTPKVPQRNNNQSRNLTTNNALPTSMPPLIKSNLIPTSVLSKSTVNMVPKAEPKPEPTEAPATVSPAWLSSKTGPQRKLYERLGLHFQEERPSIQSRLFVKQEPTTDTVDHLSMVANVAEQKPIQSNSKIEKMNKLKMNEPDPREMLENYCKQRGFDAPQYSSNITKSMKFEGLVRFGGMTYSTQPFDYITESEAHKEAAVLALDNVKDFPVSAESDEMIAQKMFEFISENGIFMNHLPNIFEQKYDKSLPVGWEGIIRNRPEMFEIVHQPTNNDIVYKRTQTEAKQPSNTSTPKRIQRDESDVFELPQMTLPWDEGKWNIDVTLVNSTIDVWCTWSDSSYMTDLNDALEPIELSLMNGNSLTPCRKVAVGGIYLTPIVKEDLTIQVYRVKVKTIDDSQKKALCFYIDDGFEEELTFDSTDDTELKLYHIPTDEICQIPAQAINFSLFNLEDFADHPYANEEMACLPDNQFSAKPKTSKEDYEKDGKLCFSLFDMTATDDTLMNRKILQKICDRFQRPELDKRHNLVYVTHINDTGDIYCQLYNSKDMQNIKKIIKRLTVNGISEDYRLNATDLNYVTSNALRLVFDTSNNHWYRAEILSSYTNDGIIVKCKFVDYGYIKYVPLEHVYKLGTALNKYPHQTITVQLNEFLPREFKPNVVKRLREVLCEQKRLCYVQPIKLDDIPKVNVWKRIENVLCKINDSIRIELEMEESPDFLSIPDVDDSFGPDEKDLKKSTDLPIHPKPDCHEIHKVKVITASMPSHFFIRLSSNSPDYEAMMHSLWKEFDNSEPILTKNQVQIKQFYAGRLTDGYWHRVKVQSILSNSVIVLKWDSGDIDQLTIDALRPLPSAYRKIPQMGFPARLHGIKPIKKVWNKDNCDHFIELTVAKEFKAEIMAVKTEQDDEFTAEVVLVTPQKINIGEYMVREQRAVYDSP